MARRMQPHPISSFRTQTLTGAEATMNEHSEQALLAPLQVVGRHMLTVLPNIFAMGTLVLGGLLAAWLSSLVVERLLRVIGLDHLSNRLGTTAALLQAGIKTDPSRIIGAPHRHGLHI